MSILFVIYVYVAFFQKVNTSAVYFYPTGIDWFEASQRCNKDRSEFEHDIDVLSSLVDFQDHEFWIGIIQHIVITPWMELLNCVECADITAKTIQKSVGYCQNECQLSSYFSYQISTKECQCLNINDLSQLNNVSYSDCLSGYSTDNSMLIYQQFDSMRLPKGNGNCMVFQCPNQKVERESMVCSARNLSIQALCDDFTTPDKQQNWGLKYETAQNKCFKSNRNLMSPHNCPSKPITSFTWTSSFREEIVFEYFEETPKDAYKKICLSGKRKHTSDSKKIIIDINQRSCNGTLKFFACTSGKGNIEIKPKTSSKDQGALVGGIMGGVITIVIVTLLIIWKRRTKNINHPAANSKTSEPSIENLEYSPVNEVTKQHCGNLKEHSKPLPEYAIVQKGNKPESNTKPEYAIIRKEEKQSTPDDTYTVASDGNYDKLNNVLSRKITQEPNMYSISGQCAEGEYDTMKGVKVSNVKRTDNLYDTNTSMYK